MASPSPSSTAPTSTAETKTQGSARSEYESQRAMCADTLGQLRSQNQRLVLLRSISFPAAALCLLFGYLGDSYQTPLIIFGWLAAIVFFVAIIAHEHLRLARLSQESDLKLFNHLLARLDRNWSALPTTSLLPQHQDLAYADDLDIAGPASLLSLLGLANTYPGNATLQKWLAAPPKLEDLHQRQAAIQSLASDRALRLQILRTVRAAGSSVHEPYGLPNWARTPNWLHQHQVAWLLSYIGPCIVFLGIFGIVVGYSLKWPAVTTGFAITLAIGFLINILVTVFWGSWLHDIFQKVTGEHRGVYQFASVFELMAQLPDEKDKNGLLSRIKSNATQSETCATRGFAKLLTLVRFANLQKDVFLYFVYLTLQLLFLYDFRILKSLEAWKARFGPHVVDWFEALGTCEALVSGATLADEYPTWTYSTPPKGDTTLLAAESLGHPLLSDQARVVNDFRLAADRPLVVVTGSNMAGKSTFLRAIGLNILLARTGAPCCAQSFQAPIFELATSIRVRDSLSDGVSFFMAELKRLKEVVDQSREFGRLRQTTPDTPRMLFLLDEILQGTNSQERQIAVATVLQQLLGCSATGFISTHDLDLADAREVKDVSQVVHFREFFEMVDGKEVMRFDYRMRPGPTPTTNALKLLRLVGLDPE